MQLLIPLKKVFFFCQYLLYLIFYEIFFLPSKGNLKNVLVQFDVKKNYKKIKINAFSHKKNKILEIILVHKFSVDRDPFLAYCKKS